jgi:hypothetical protein
MSARRMMVWEMVAAVSMLVARNGSKRNIPAYPGGPTWIKTECSAWTIADRLGKLTRIAATLHRLAETACNEDTAIRQPVPETGYAYTRAKGSRVWSTEVISDRQTQGLIHTGRTYVDGATCNRWRAPDGSTIAQLVQNSQPGTDDGARFEARIDRLEARAKAIGCELGVIVTVQRDPRGAPIKLWSELTDEASERGTMIAYIHGGR